MKITILTDTSESWIVPYARRLVEDLLAVGHNAALVFDQNDITNGECAFFLGCQKIVRPDTLLKNKHNLVVHESALPAGKGWSPLTWQILEGKNDIPITLFEAEKNVDAGPIYFQEIMRFSGGELVGELRARQGETTIALVKKFVSAYPHITPRAQTGPESFYARRTPRDSELDPEKSIAEQFNLLRVVDNENYPAWFKRDNQTYILKISKLKE